MIDKNKIAKTRDFKRQSNFNKRFYCIGYFIIILCLNSDAFNNLFNLFI